MLKNKELGFGIYIHVPFCLRKCRYCDFYSRADSKMISRFVSALIKEILTYKSKEIQPKTIFLGGGTPSLLAPVDLEKIFSTLAAAFDLSQTAEISIECNPGTVSAEKFAAFRSVGINRVSLGIQSLDDAELKFLGRIHSAREALEAIDEAHSAGFENVSGDMIYSLPGQHFESVRRTAAGLISAGVSHISAYTLIFEEGTPLYREMISGRIKCNSADDEADLYMKTCSYLVSNKFNQYEISNFAKAGFECLHNLNYWRRGEYFGFGPSAHAFRAGERYWNIADTDVYCSKIEAEESPVEGREKLSEKEAMLEKIYLSLRAEGIDFAKFKAEFGIDPGEKNSRLFAELIKCGDAEFSTDGIFRLTTSGYALCDGIVREIEI